MKKALIVYHSKNGTTEKFGNEIGSLCTKAGLGINTISLDEFTQEALNGVDFIFLGCWTHGLMVLFQHPDEQWVKFAQTLPELNGRKIVLFTTYKIATGSMFKKMRKHIKCSTDDILMELKSRDGRFSEGYGELLTAIHMN